MEAAEEDLPADVGVVDDVVVPVTDGMPTLPGAGGDCCGDDGTAAMHSS